MIVSKRRPSMRDVADAANVSVSAVSLVVRGKPGVAAETRERIWETIAKLGYTVPTPENDKTPTVGLLIERGSMPAILDIFYGEVIHGFQTEAQRLGYQVLLHMFDRGQERFDRMYASLCDEVQGFVIANDGDITAEMIAQSRDIGLPLVLIESYIPGQQLPCVIGDNFLAGYTTTQHLLALGHRAIGIIQGPTKYSSLLDRKRGCMAALAEQGLLVRPEWMPPAQTGPGRRGYSQMLEILRQAERPTAIVAVSDKTAFGAIEAIKEAGLRIPEDIAISSIDDVADSAHARPPLTSYQIARADMGALAMQKLHRLISGESEIAVKSIVYGRLVVRESSGERLQALAAPADGDAAALVATPLGA